MEAVVGCCAGLDVHQATVVACLNNGRTGKRSGKEIRTYGTTGQELREMRDWLKASGCTLAAMESTGVYWKPVYAELEGISNWLSATLSTSRMFPDARRTRRTAIGSATSRVMA